MNLAKQVEAILLKYHAWPNSGFPSGWVERDLGTPGNGGMKTPELSELVLMMDGNQRPTEIEVGNMERKLRRHANLLRGDGVGKNAAGPLCRFIRKRQPDYAWALDRVP